MGPSEYKLIINYVNVDLYLDQVNPGKGIDGLTIYAMAPILTPTWWRPTC